MSLQNCSYKLCWFGFDSTELTKQYGKIKHKDSWSCQGGITKDFCTEHWKDVLLFPHTCVCLPNLFVTEGKSWAPSPCKHPGGFGSPQCNSWMQALGSKALPINRHFLHSLNTPCDLSFRQQSIYGKSSHSLASVRLIFAAFLTTVHADPCC